MCMRVYQLFCHLWPCNMELSHVNNGIKDHNSLDIIHVHILCRDMYKQENVMEKGAWDYLYNHQYFYDL